MRVFWMEASPWDPANAVAVTLRAVNVDLTAVVMFEGSEYLPIIDGGPIFSTTVFNGIFSGSADSSRGQINLLTGAGEIDSWAALAWQGRSVKLWSAVIDTSDPMAPVWPTSRELMFDGLAESFDPDEATVTLTTMKPEGQIAKAAYAGTGGLEGTAELRGSKKPVAFGLHTNRPPTLLNASKLLFQCNGVGATILYAVREGGNRLDQPMVGHPTFDSLFAATVPATEIHYHAVTGTFRIGFTPAGEISADFRGGLVLELPNPTTVTTIANWMLTLAGWTRPRNAASFDAVVSLVPDDAQFFDSQGIDVADALTELLRGAGSYWDVSPLGEFYVGVTRRRNGPDFIIGDEGLGQYDLLETDYLPTRAPIWKYRVGWGQNPNVLSFGDMALGITSDQLDLLYSVQDLVDGTLEIFIQSTEPTGSDRDLWYNTSNQIWYKRDGGAWVPTPGLGALGDALLAAAGAQAAADGKIKSFYQDTAPTGQSFGDLWIKPGELPRRTYSWNNTSWVAVATRSDDPTNLISSPVTLDQTILQGPATREVNEMAEGRLATNYRIRMDLFDHSVAYWDGVAGVPCAGGERLYYRHVVFAGQDGPAMCQGAFRYLRADGSIIGAEVVPGTAVTATNVFGINWLTVTGSLVTPENCARVVAYAERFPNGSGAQLYIGEPFLSRSQPGSDITAENQHTIADVPEVVIRADAGGTVLSGQLPVTVPFRRLVGIRDVSPQSVYAIESASPGITVTLNNNADTDDRGNLTITAMSNNTASVNVRATFGGYAIVKTLTARLQLDPPVTGGGTGGGGGDGAPGNPATTNTIYLPTDDGNNREIAILSAVVVGASGQVSLTSNLSFSAQSQGALNEQDGEPPIDTIMGTTWQFLIEGGSAWSDVGLEQDSSPANHYFSISYPKGDRNYPGSVNHPRTATGFTSGARVIFRMLGRLHYGQPIITISGSIQATPN